MTRLSPRIPLSVLMPALGLASIAGIPVLFVAVNQVRRVCGSDLFGSRQHFCSAVEVGRWMQSLPGWIPMMIVAVVIGARPNLGIWLEATDLQACKGIVGRPHLALIRVRIRTVGNRLGRKHLD